MTARNAGLKPVIREAPPVELHVYRVYEHQLDLLAQGSPASLMLNFALFFLGASLSLLATLLTATLGDRPYYTFLILCTIGLIAGFVLLAIWFFTHTSTRILVREIKAQMPPNPAIQEESITADTNRKT